MSLNMRNNESIAEESTEFLLDRSVSNAGLINKAKGGRLKALTLNAMTKHLSDKEHGDYHHEDQLTKE